PALPQALARSAVDSRWCRVVVGIVVLIPQAHAVFIEPSQRLLKQPRFRIARRHSSLADIELVFVHVHACECPRLISIIRELKLKSLGKVQEIPDEVRHLDITLDQMPCRLNDRSSSIAAPVSRTTNAAA